MDEPLVRMVAGLRAERDGLRRAMRSRAVIEQAKGVLMARLRLTADEAFARLLSVSQHSNVKLAQVAATVVTTASPPPPDEPPDGPVAAAPPPPPDASLVADVAAAAVDHPDEPAAAHTRHVLAVARLHAAGSYDDIVDALADATPAPASVVLLLTEADGALRLVAWRGLTPEVASQWHRIPPQVEIPLTDAVRRATPIWLPDPESVVRAYPIMASIGGGGQAVAALPLLDGGRVIGVVGLSWSGEQALAPRRPYLTALGAVCGPVAVRIAAEPGLAGTEEVWLRPLLDAVVGSAAVLRPVRSGDRVVDFVFEMLNEQAIGEAVRYGIPTERDVLLSELPGPREALLRFYREVLAGGKPLQLDEVTTPGSSVALRAVRLGDRVVAVWRTRSPGEILYEDLVATERTVGAASFRWRPRVGQWWCSPNLPELLGWPAAGPPLGPTTLWRAVSEGHWPAVRRAVVAALRDGGPARVTVLTRPGRWLRVTMSRTPDGDLRGTVHDLGELRAALARRPH